MWIAKGKYTTAGDYANKKDQLKRPMRGSLFSSTIMAAMLSGKSHAWNIAQSSLNKFIEYNQ